MPGVTGSGSGHTIGVETGHTSVTGYGNRAYMCIPHEYIVVGSSSLSESVSSSFIAQHRHACSAMLIATSNHANTHPAESTSHRARNTSPHTHSSPAIVGFSTDNLKCPTHFARASHRATTRCLRRVTMRYHLTYSNTFCCYAWLCRLDIHCAHVVGLVRGQFR